jgi:transcriptional accessory protein Tex/SPT6
LTAFATQPFGTSVVDLHSKAFELSAGFLRIRYGDDALDAE